MVMGQVTALRYLVRPGSRELVWYPVRQHLSWEAAYSDGPRGFVEEGGQWGPSYSKRVYRRRLPCVAA